jgi:hypothetical protein
MSRRKIKAGSTSVTVPIFVQDTSSTTGGGLGPLAYNTPSLAAKYRRQGDSSWTTITLATATLGTFTSGGFVSDGGPVTGGHEVGIPNAALAAGANWCEVVYYGAANMLPVLLEFELDAIDYQGTPDVNVTKVNSVSAASVTAINANLGTTQPLNFTGTGGSALAKSDMVDIAGAAVSAGTAQMGVNVVNFGGSAGTFASGVPAVNATQIAGNATAATNAAAGWAGLIADTGTAQAGASTTITLRSGAVATDDYYTGSAVAITGGTGAGQVRKITGYVGSTKVATVDTAWATNPNNPSTYQVLGRIV